MSKCAKVEPVVEKVLREKEYTRDDDFALVLEVFREFVPDIDNKSFADVMINHKEYGLPYFETVRRTRPKLQNKHPELLGNKEVQLAREAEQSDYRDYALDRG